MTSEAAPEPFGNSDPATIAGFGHEWPTFDTSKLVGEEYERIFNAYFGIFPFASLRANAEGFDIGCGSGRWAAGVAPRVRRLHCIDPAAGALELARRELKHFANVNFHLAATDSIRVADGSQNFEYSLGVLHHIPDTARAMKDCVRKLKSGAPFLLYLSYALEDRPLWFRTLWRLSDFGRRLICRTPFGTRRILTNMIAALVYWPLARIALLVEKLGWNPESLPLSGYRQTSFYTMRTDALDRFGTALEQRLKRVEVERMMSDAGLDQIRFADGVPRWITCGVRRH